MTPNFSTTYFLNLTDYPGKSVMAQSQLLICRMINHEDAIIGHEPSIFVQKQTIKTSRIPGPCWSVEEKNE